MIFTTLSFLSLIYGLFFVWVGNVSQTICLREGVINVTLNMICHWEHYQQQPKYRNMIEKIWHILRSIRKKCLKSVKKKILKQNPRMVFCSLFVRFELAFALWAEQNSFQQHLWPLHCWDIFALFSEAVARRCSVENVFIKSWQNP